MTNSPHGDPFAAGVIRSAAMSADAPRRRYLVAPTEAEARAVLQESNWPAADQAFAVPSPPSGSSAPGWSTASCGADFDAGRMGKRLTTAM